MSRLASVALALAAGDPSPPPPVPPTRMGTELLARRPLVAVARTVSVTNFGIGTAVVRMTVEERLCGAGAEPGEDVVVLTYAGHFRAGDRDLLHLLPFGRRGRYEVLQRVSGQDPDHRAKLSMTRRQIALMDVAERQSRAAATFELLLASLASADEWTRSYAAAELTWMAQHQRWVFTPTRIRRLSTLARSAVRPDVRAGVERVTTLLSSDPGPLPRGPEQESSPP